MKDKLYSEVEVRKVVLEEYFFANNEISISMPHDVDSASEDFCDIILWSKTAEMHSNSTNSTFDTFDEYKESTCFEISLCFLAVLLCSRGVIGSHMVGFSVKQFGRYGTPLFLSVFSIVLTVFISTGMDAKSPVVLSINLCLFAGFATSAVYLHFAEIATRKCHIFPRVISWLSPFVGWYKLKPSLGHTPSFQGASSVVPQTVNSCLRGGALPFPDADDRRIVGRTIAETPPQPHQYNNVRQFLAHNRLHRIRLEAIGPNGFRFYTNHIRSMINEWFYDWAMDNALLIYAQTCRARGNFVVIPTQDSSRWFYPRQDPGTGLPFSPESMDEDDRIRARSYFDRPFITTVNVGDHWIILSRNQHGLLRVYDPAGMENYYIPRLRLYFGRLWHLVMPSDQHRTHHFEPVRNHPRQLFSGPCGPLCLREAEIYLNDSSEEVQTDEISCQRYRDEIIQLLINYTDPVRLERVRQAENPPSSS